MMKMNYLIFICQINKRRKREKFLVFYYLIKGVSPPTGFKVPGSSSIFVTEFMDFYFYLLYKFLKIASPATTTKSGDKMFSIGSLSLNAAPDLDL